MNGVISMFFGVVILFPFLVTLLFLVVVRKTGKAPASAIGLAADVTTPFLFLTVYIVSHTVFGEGVGIYIAGIAIMIAIVRVIIERVKVKEFQVVRLLRKTWRLYFLVLSMSYVLLILVGIIGKVVEYAK